MAGLYVCPYEVFMLWRLFLNIRNAQWESSEETLATDMHSVEMKLANLSKQSCHGRIALERRKCDEILTKCHFPAAYKLVSSLWAVQRKHLNNRKLDWRETAARNKALYIFSLIQRHPPGKLGVHSCVVNKIAKWQHDRMIETLIERLKRGEAEGRGKQRRCKPRFLLKSSSAMNPFMCTKDWALWFWLYVLKKGAQTLPGQS